MQRIVIKNFGPIKEVDIPVHDFMIFIGPQASGKSTIAKAIYFFQELPERLFQFIYNSKDEITIRGFSDFNKEVFRQIIEFLNEFYPNNLQGEFNLKFYYDFEKQFSIEFFNNKEEIKVSYSKSLEDAVSILFGKLVDAKKGNNDLLDKSIINEILVPFWATNFGGGGRNTFIPAGRSIFSIFSNQLLVTDKGTISIELQKYAFNVNSLRKQYAKGVAFRFDRNPIDKLANKLSLNILKGTYSHKDRSDIIEIEQHVELLLENSSSGQQESLWVLLDLYSTITSIELRSLIIEEPEAHLYPEAQKYISELIALCVNQKDNQVIITTHSPYILGAINNLLYANEVGKKFPEKVEKVVDKNLWLDYDRVMAYFVDDGGVRSIMDDEMKMIKNEEIDSASREINKEYDTLSNIEYSK